MQIINNKIFIARGETATYDVTVLDKNTGIPLQIINGVNDKNPIIEFVVKPSIYGGKDDYVFKAYIDKSDSHVFETDEVALYDADNLSFWDDEYLPHEGDEEKLHRRIYNKINYFAYYLYDYTSEGTFSDREDYNGYYLKLRDDRYVLINTYTRGIVPGETVCYSREDEGQWIPYEFRLTFMFPYETMAKLVAKTYKYEVTLLSGTSKESLLLPDEIPIIVDYKKPILEATDFVVGGSLSE